jgi:type II secretory pathway pseudopilin PulG
MPWTCPSCRQENPETAQFCAECGAPISREPAQDAPPPAVAPLPPPPPGAPPAAPPTKGKTGKRLLILGGLAVVLFFCCVVAGIIGAIAVPNFLDASEKSRQKRAVEEVKGVAGALQAFAQENGGLYPDTGHQEGMYYTTVDAEKLVPFLVPKYASSVPAKDPWNVSYEYGVSPGNDAFVVICGGSDKKVSLAAIPGEPMETHCFEDDILWENDRFLQTPGGKQKRCQ